MDYDFKDFVEWTNGKSKTRLNLKELNRYWKQYLFNKVLTLFKWSGLPFPQKELEKIALFYGFCGVVKHDKEIIATIGSMFGVTNYYDEFLKYIYITPIVSGEKEIAGNECVILNNTECRTSIIPLINRHALLLTHADLSLQAVLINARTSGVLTAPNQQTKANLDKWYDGLVNGSTMSIVDEISMTSLSNAEGVRNVSTFYPQSTSIADFYDTTQNLLKSFYNAIGIRMVNPKKERMISSEVNSDDNMLSCDLEEMLKCRKQFCEEYNKKFNANISVEKNSEIFKEYDEKEGVDNVDKND